MSKDTIPTDREVFEGPMATYWIDDGILVSQSKNVLRTVAMIAENVDLVRKITQNKKMPLLIYLTKSPVPDKATRQFSTEQLPQIYTAMAMISKPGLAKFIMSLLFALQSPPIPMRTFSDVNEAKAWLRQFIEP